jgi:hypothetical protein
MKTSGTSGLAKPPALGRNVALLKAVKLRHVADTYKYLFSNELKPTE